MLTVGIDLGGTNIVVGLVNAEGQIIRKTNRPTLANRDYHLIVKDMAEMIEELLQVEQMTEDDIHSIGIGSPGLVDSVKGEIIYANNLHFDNTPLRAELSRYFSIPVHLGNDANVAAYGEYVCGAGLQFKNLVAITLGTGVGSGIIIDGKMIEGAFYGGAELGHTVLMADGPQCTCGRRGCWEQFSSATALIRDGRQAATNSPQSLLNQCHEGALSQLNAKDIFDVAQAGDEVARGVIDRYLRYLAIGLVNVINIFQPEVIVLGGGISAQRQKLTDPLIGLIRNETYGGAESLKTELRVAELGNDAGVIGAAFLYRQAKTEEAGF